MLKEIFAAAAFVAAGVLLGMTALLLNGNINWAASNHFFWLVFICLVLNANAYRLFSR